MNAEISQMPDEEFKLTPPELQPESHERSVDSINTIRLLPEQISKLKKEMPARKRGPRAAPDLNYHRDWTIIHGVEALMKDPVIAKRIAELVSAKEQSGIDERRYSRSEKVGSA